jgi:hypothetical protein
MCATTIAELVLPAARLGANKPISRARYVAHTNIGYAQSRARSVQSLRLLALAPLPNSRATAFPTPQCSTLKRSPVLILKSTYMTSRSTFEDIAPGNMKVSKL